MPDKEKEKNRMKKWRAENVERIKNSGKLYHNRKKEEIKLNYVINQKLKKHVMVGKLKRVELPTGIIAILKDRFRIDETSKTGLRWSDSSCNKSYTKGKEAGNLSIHGYYNIGIHVGPTLYKFGVARIIWMIANTMIIEPGMAIDHKNRQRDDNRIVNLQLGSINSNNVNRSNGLCVYKNVRAKTGSCGKRFLAAFTFLGIRYYTKCVASLDAAFLLGWELLTSGEVPLAYVKSQSNEWKDGTYLKRALAECKKQGIAVKRPKFKTLHEYIASVEGSC